MAEVDVFATLLLDEAKRFLEKAIDEDSEEGKTAYLHAALNLAFCAFEAHLSSIADDFLVGGSLNLLDGSILSEREVQLMGGQFVLSDRPKMYRLEDRLEFIHLRFSGKPIDKTSSAWSDLKNGLRMRHKLTHPKEVVEISEALTRRTLEAIIRILDTLYQNIFGRPYPGLRRGLDSSLSF